VYESGGICQTPVLLLVVITILAGNCSKTKQPQNRGVFHLVFCTSIASVSLHVLDLVITQPLAFITRLLS